VLARLSRERTLTMWPAPFAISTGTKARIAAYVSVKLTGISRSIASGDAPSGPTKKAVDALPDL